MLNVRNHRRTAIAFCFYGFLIGLIFPIFGYSLAAASLKQNPWEVFCLHGNPLLYIIDVLPFITAAIALIFGYRESRLEAFVSDRSRERLEAAERVGKYGSWEMNLDTFEVQWSKGLYKLYGLDPSSEPSYEAFMDIVYPDDRDKVIRATAQIQTEKPETFANDLRIVTRDTRELKHYRSSGAFVADVSTGGQKVIGITHDITEIVEAKEAAIKIERERAQLIALNAMIVTYKHEINTPLAIAMASLGALDADMADDPNIEQTESALWRIAEILRKVDEISAGKEIEFISYANSSTKMIKLD
ncbi:MAG: hypothetical protein EOP05_04655 [Proteobacteria bacterium]|nr:MAG: hypothetical protein EOP05_04655 [Pseudomonadota bacterium]